MRTTLIVAYLVATVAIAQAAWIPDSSWGQPRHHSYDEHPYSHRPQQNEPEGPEQQLALYTYWLTIFTAIVGGGTLLLFGANAWLAWLTHRGVVLGRDEFIATHRPWVYVVRADISDALIFRDQGASVELQLTVAVIGETPARKIVASGKMIYATDGAKIIAAQAAFCRSLRDEQIPDGAYVPERSWFPGQEPAATNVGFSMTDKELFALRTNKVTKIIPVLIGAVSYIDANDKWHQTGFIYDLYRYANGTRDLMAISIENGTVDRNSLQLRKNEAGSGPAD